MKSCINGAKRSNNNFKNTFCNVNELCINRVRQSSTNNIIPHCAGDGDVRINNKVVSRSTFSDCFSLNKKNYIDLLRDSTKPIVICTGPTGSGKTYLSCMEGTTGLSTGKYKKMIITRPAVSIENEDHGFLPGNLNNKMDPWIRPIYDNINETIGVREFDSLLRHKIVEICPFGYIRGRTFNNTYVIADEMQNSTKMQFQTLLTRLGEDSKIVINGDLNQSDNPSKDGLSNFLFLLEKYLSVYPIEYISLVALSNEDIRRHPAINEILNIYSNN